MCQKAYRSDWPEVRQFCANEPRGHELVSRFRPVDVDRKYATHPFEVGQSTDDSSSAKVSTGVLAAWNAHLSQP